MENFIFIYQEETDGPIKMDRMSLEQMQEKIKFHKLPPDAYGIIKGGEIIKTKKKKKMKAPYFFRL